MISLPRITVKVFIFLGVWAHVAAVRQEDSSNETFLKLLSATKHSQPYQSILLENCARSSFLSQIWTRLQIPTLQLLSTTHHEPELNVIFNRQFLAIVCFEDGIASADVLTVLAEQLQHIRSTPIILRLGNSSSTSAEVHLRQTVEMLFRHSQNLQMLNVIALLDDFERSQTVYTFDAFPEFKLKTTKFNPVSNYFPDKTSQLFGHPVYTLPDQNEPRSLLYRDAHGVLKMSGYVGQLVLTFCQHINATLRFPFPVKIGDTTLLSDQLNYTRSGVIDFATSLASYKFFGGLHEYTKPVDFAQWLMMLPMERELAVNEMFLYIFRSKTVIYIIVMGAIVGFLLNVFQYFQFMPHQTTNRPFWSTLIIRDQTFRGILGQSFPIAPYSNWRISLTYSSFFIFGLITSCLFSIYMKTFLTQPPRKPRISSLEDLAKSDVRCLTNEPEIAVFKIIHGEDTWERYKAGFEVISSLEEFVSRRLSFDTSRGYTLTTPLWPIIEIRQSSYRQKLFRLTTDIILNDFLVLGMQIQENSIYKSALNWFIVAANEAGLIKHWHLLTFYDMVAIGSIKHADMGTPRHYKILVLSDFNWMGWMFGVSYSVSTLVFVLELLFFKLRKKERIIHKNKSIRTVSRDIKILQRP